MKNYLDSKRKEICKLNPEKGNEIFYNGLKTAKNLAINSYQEQLRRGEKIQKSINAVLTSVSFLFAGLMLFVSFSYGTFVKKPWELCILFATIFVILSAIVLMILASMYKKYDCYKNTEVQVKGTFEKLINEYGVIDGSFVPGLEETILLDDLFRVHKSVEKGNTTKRRLLKASIILLLVFIVLFAFCLIIFAIEGRVSINGQQQ